MKDWKDVLLKADTDIKSGIELIDKIGMQILLIVDEANHLLGTVTDGDIRRGILKGVGLNQPITEIMNKTPCTVNEDNSRDDAYKLMVSKIIKHCPVVNEQGVVVGIHLLETMLANSSNMESPVIIMAGGLGSRLAPLTDDTPKPLLKVGGKPIIDTIIDRFIEQNFKEFYVSVNYKSELIKEHLGDGQDRSIHIHYLEENQRLGTAGALSLLPVRPTKPIIVMNADLLTKVDFRSLIHYHHEHGSSATMCVREYDFQVPYGVVKLDGSNIRKIVEKPVHRFFVNAGVYCLAPDVLDVVPRNHYFEMPELFNKLRELDKTTCCFPIREYWLDIGQHADYNRANKEYHTNFTI